MNKKIIAVLLLATMLFMSVFAACGKNESEIYADDDEIDYVTDENGNKVLDYDGRFIVYATDEDGKKIKDENGEYVTQAQEFQPIIEDGVLEDLGFFFNIPEGWVEAGKFGSFSSKDGTRTVEISIVKQFYDDYYDTVYGDYKEMLDFNEANAGKTDEQIIVTWNEEIDFGKEYKGICRFTLETSDSIIVMYFFENSTNLYKVRYIAESNKDNAIAESEEMLKAMSFKPYAYYSDITAKSTTAAVATTTK